MLQLEFSGKWLIFKQAQLSSLMELGKGSNRAENHTPDSEAWLTSDPETINLTLTVCKRQASKQTKNGPLSEHLPKF